jgi:glutamate-1-semialdehyde 2,1-aminomutase
VDGNSYIDYWQGHYANILGHNPAAVRAALRTPGGEGCLHTGFEAESQVELAELILGQLGAGDFKVRFTTSGSLATMYAVMLAMARTGREEVLKVAGGWHGASPFLLRGVKYDAQQGFGAAASAGVHKDILRKTRVVPFNDAQALEDALKRRGDKTACFILEPFLGVGGFLPARPEYLREARRLTSRHGVVLIFDEIISGFRFCPSGVQTLYGIKPDLSTFGKLIGGGHTIAAVVGRGDIMEQCERRPGGGPRVLFEGGTFSSHAAYTRSGAAMIRHLIARAPRIYPRLAASGERLRRGVEAVFRAAGIDAVCTGGPNDVLPGSSLFMVHFPKRSWQDTTPEVLNDPSASDVELREEVLKLALLVEGVHVVHGGGAVSLAHGAEDIEGTIEAYARVAGLMKKFL